ncbi:MAG: choline/glycine/proline betaine transport protein [Arcticibacterium sp.]|jgi:choline/glycine/proline betaine transport protein
MKKYFDIYPNVFFPSIVLILAFVIVAIFGGPEVLVFFNKAATTITTNTGWLFILGVNFFVVVCLWLAFSKYGKIRLGGKNAKPDFKIFSWFSMLFSAGMGIGLLYFSVSEPITHFSSHPLPTASVADRAIQALNFTYLHYGLHAWGIYCLVGLSLAYFSFNKHLPFSLRSVFFPIMGRKIFGIRGDIIDIIAVVATLFGLATSLGFGAKQIAAGLFYLFGISSGLNTQITIITVITLIATVSVVTGLKKGVRFLSRLNLIVALIFLIGAFLLSDSIKVLNIFVESTGNYFSTFLDVGTWSSAFIDQTWQSNWSIFYWAWWIAWSPFVGMFIARVSRGRTIKEFVLGVLLVPTGMTFLWISVFGGSALLLEVASPGLLSSPIAADSASSLFVFLKEFPFSSVTSVLGIFMVSVFFVTSSDSGSLVIDSITSGGKLDAPVGQRIMWALLEGVVAIALLVGGGLKAMQTASVSSGILFILILFVMCFSLLKSLKRKRLKREKKIKTPPSLWD